MKIENDMKGVENAILIPNNTFSLVINLSLDKKNSRWAINEIFINYCKKKRLTRPNNVLRNELNYTFQTNGWSKIILNGHFKEY